MKVFLADQEIPLLTGEGLHPYKLKLLLDDTILVYWLGALTKMVPLQSYGSAFNTSLDRTISCVSY